MPADPAPAATESPRGTASSHRRAIFAGSVGNAVEWFDWTIYASFAVFFSGQFFPPGNETAALLSTFLIFAVGFFMRPIGGWALGILADRHGRKVALALAVTMISGGSLIIALSPTYGAVGVIAPLILVFARLIQGLSLGGQYASATTFLTEMAPNHRRGFYSSFVFMSAAAGILVASALGWCLTNYLSLEQMRSWGWRVPFLMGALGGPIGWWIQHSVVEEAPKKPGTVVKQPLRTLLRDHRTALLRILGFSVLSTYAFYIFVPYVPTYAIRSVGAVPSVAFAANTVAVVVFMLVQPLFGMISDRIGRKPQLIAFTLGYLLFFYSVMTNLSPTFGSLVAVELFGLLLYAMYSSIAPAIMAEQFPRNVRAVGIGTPYNLMVAMLGGTTPYLLTYLQSVGREQMFFVIVLVGAAISLVTFATMPEMAGKPLR